MEQFCAMRSILTWKKNFSEKNKAICRKFHVSARLPAGGNLLPAVYCARIASNRSAAGMDSVTK